ncbi:hypothetical protein DID88_001279 [Monilinia fructigena]|uniref:Uncharacterized protein n=1 Tax=Monilinia fructigena TaxID=38457 RepID=A0A395J0H1_9HELO|nr:hypothetical protein DID88_001279 [Monilinia fructigena]
MADQFVNLNMGNAQGPLRGHHNQLFVPGFGANQIPRPLRVGVISPQNFEEWNNAAQGETRYPFGYKLEFGGNGANGVVEELVEGLDRRNEVW